MANASAVVNPWDQIRSQPINPDDLEAYLQGEGADLAPPPPAIIPLDRSPAAVKPQADATKQVVSVPKGSKDFNKGVHTESQDSKTISAVPIPMDPDTFRSAFESAYKSKPIQDMVQGQKGLQSILAMELAQPKALDLSPIMNLVDTWTGSKLSQGYKPPETPQSVRDKILAFSEKLQNNQRDIAKAVIDAVGRTKGTLTTTDQQFIRDAITKGSGSPTGAKNPDSSTIGYAKLAQADPRLKEADKAVNEANATLALLDNKNPISDFAARMKSMRTYGVGRITNFEYDNMLTKSLIGKYDQTISQLETGVTSGENRDSLRKTAATLGQIAQQIAKSRRADLVSAGGKMENVNPEVIKTILGGYPEVTPPPPQPPSMQQIIMDEFNKRKANQ